MTEDNNNLENDEDKKETWLSFKTCDYSILSMLKKNDGNIRFSLRDELKDVWSKYIKIVLSGENDDYDSFNDAFKDLEEGITTREIIDESTGLSSNIVMDLSLIHI